MNKTLRTGLSVIGVLVIMLVVAAVVFIYTADYNRHKGLIEKAVMDATGRQLVIKGDLAVVMSLPPELSVGDATLANAPWGSQPQMAHIGQLRVRVRLIPLLMREIDITRIRLIDTDLLLETDARGQANWHFSKTAGARTGAGMLGVAVKHLQVEQLAVTVRNAESGAPAAHYKLDRLELTRSAAADALAVELQGSLNGQPLALSGQTGPLLDLFAGVRFPLALSGEVAGAKLNLDGGLDNAVTLAGLDLTVQASGSDLASLGTGMGVKIPHTDSFDLTAQLTTSGDQLAVRDARGSVSYKRTKLALNGQIGDLKTLEAIQLALKSSGSDLAELSSVVGKTLPTTGPFEISGRLTGSAKALALSEAQGTISQQNNKFSLAGGIDDLLTVKGISLDVKGSGKNLGELRSLLGDKLPDTGPFSATARLSGSAQTLAVHELRANVKRGNAHLTVSGEVGDVRKLTGIELGLEGAGKQLGELGPMFDTQLPDLGAFNIKAQLSGSDKLLELKSFSATVDQSDFTGWAKAEFGERPRVTVRLESGLVDFTRIMQQAKSEKKADTGNAEKGKVGGPGHALFSDKPLPFNLLNVVDADITFKARNIKARDAALEFGQLALRLDAGDLRVDKLEVTYRGTKVSGNLNLTAGTPASVAVRFLVQGFDLGRFLKETHVSQDVEGQVDLAADLKSRGNSRHQLMANLDGISGAVIGKGYVPRFLDLLAQDLSRRVISIWGRHKRAGELNCGVIQFTSKQGIATSDAFLFDTQLAILKGDGDINLATEQLDFVLSPKPRDRSLFSLATKLHVTGSVLDPRVRPDMSSVATKGVKALSSLVLGPAGLLVPFMNAGAPHQHPCDVEALKNRVHSIYD